MWSRPWRPFVPRYKVKGNISRCASVLCNSRRHAHWLCAHVDSDFVLFLCIHQTISINSANTWRNRKWEHTHTQAAREKNADFGFCRILHRFVGVIDWRSLTLLTVLKNTTDNQLQTADVGLFSSFSVISREFFFAESASKKDKISSLLMSEVRGQRS